MGEGAYWPSYAKDYYNNAVVDSKLPTSLDEMEIILDGQKGKALGQRPNYSRREDVRCIGKTARLLRFKRQEDCGDRSLFGCRILLKDSIWGRQDFRFFKRSDSGV